MRIATTINRVLCVALTALALLVPIGSAFAADYTDIWFTPAESGWGINLIQSDTYIFATFFIYGQDGKPTWVIATLSYDGRSSYSGLLSSVIGTYFGSPWIPGNVIESPIGTATFQPSASDTSHGTLTYTVVGTPNVVVTKAIQRQPLTFASFAGNYAGGESDAFSNCKDSSKNDPTWLDWYSVQVTQSSSNLVSLNFNYPFYSPALTCTLTGTLTHSGLVYGMDTATFLCSDGTDTSALMTDFKLTAQGIEGHFVAANDATNCHRDSRFSAVRQ